MNITIFDLARDYTYFARRHTSIFDLDSKLELSHVAQIFTNEN